MKKFWVLVGAAGWGVLFGHVFGVLVLSTSSEKAILVPIVGVLLILVSFAFRLSLLEKK